MEIFLYGIYLFAFIFCCLIVIKYIYITIKVLVMKEGKIGGLTKNSCIFMTALSFIITALIIGL